MKGRGSGRAAVLEDAALGLLFVSVALSFSATIEVHFTLPKLVALQLCAIPLVLLWAWRLKRGEARRVPGAVFWTGMAMGAWWIFTTFFALHTRTALDGCHGRYNGLWTHLLYLALFLLTATLAADPARAGRIVVLFVLALVPVAAYAVAQYGGLDPIEWSVRDRATSTVGHPVMLAALLGLGMPFVWTFLFQAGSALARLLWVAVLLLFILGAMATVSRGPWIGIAASSAVVVGAHLKSRWKTAAAVLAALCLGAGMLVLATPDGVDKIARRLRFSEIERDPSVGGRLLYFKAAMNVVKDHPIVGVGFEHFRIVYPKYRPPEDRVIFTNVIPTMVHDGYLQWAVTNGIPALVLYLAFAASVLIMLVRRCRAAEDGRVRGLLIAFIASIMGYLIQDLTGWLEIGFTTFFWLILGLAVAVCASGPSAAASWKREAGYVLAAVGIVVLAFLLDGSVNKLDAERLFAACRPLDVRSRWPQIERNLDAALKLVPEDSMLEHRAALSCANRVIETGDAEAYRKGMALLERAHEHNRFDPYVLINAVKLDMAAIDKGIIRRRSGFAERAVAALPGMDGNNPMVAKAIADLEQKEREGPRPPDGEGFVRLPDAAVNRPYVPVKVGMRGVGSFRWAVVEGGLPPGMILDAGGVVSGIPRVAGMYMFTVQATGDSAVPATAVLKIVITVAP